MIKRVTSPCVIAKKNTDSTATRTRYSPPRSPAALLTLLLSCVEELPYTNLRRLEFGRLD